MWRQGLQDPGNFSSWRQPLHSWGSKRRPSLTKKKKKNGRERALRSTGKCAEVVGDRNMSCVTNNGTDHLRSLWPTPPAPFSPEQKSTVVMGYLDRVNMDIVIREKAPDSFSLCPGGSDQRKKKCSFHFHLPGVRGSSLEIKSEFRAPWCKFWNVESLWRATLLWICEKIPQVKGIWGGRVEPHSHINASGVWVPSGSWGPLSWFKTCHDKFKLVSLQVGDCLDNSGGKSKNKTLV